MANWRRGWGAPILLIVVALLVTGCPKKPEVQVGVARGPEAAALPETKPEGEKVAQKEEKPAIPAPEKEPSEQPPLEDVFFDSDKTVLGEDAKKTLDAIIDWLEANPQAHIVIEGHADERGTKEYNLALGNRRAKVVRDYLVAGGIDTKRLHTMSQGEKRPFAQGHDESAWMRNRRVRFVMASEVKASLNNSKEPAEIKSAPQASPEVPATTSSPLTLGP
ncbi:MAG: OmpA family protein [Candidatus Methylomirabilales bacterium]